MANLSSATRAIMFHYISTKKGRNYNEQRDTSDINFTMVFVLRCRRLLYLLVHSFCLQCFKHLHDRKGKSNQKENYTSKRENVSKNAIENARFSSPF